MTPADLDAIEAREREALAAARDALRGGYDLAGFERLTREERRADDALRLVATLRAERASRAASPASPDLDAIEAEALRDVPPCAECSTPARWTCCFVGADARSWCGANACDAHRPANTAPHPVAPMHAHQWRRSYTLSSAAVDLVAALRESRAEVAAAEELVARQGRLLLATADAVKGPPPAGSQHSAHDLPEVVVAWRRNCDALSGAYTDARGEIDRLTAEVERLRAQLAAQAPAVARPAPVGFCEALAAVRSGRFVSAPCGGCGASWPADGAERCPACGWALAAHNPDRAQLAALARREGEAFAAQHPHAAGALMGGVAHRSEVTE